MISTSAPKTLTRTLYCSSFRTNHVFRCTKSAEAADSDWDKFNGILLTHFVTALWDVSRNECSKNSALTYAPASHLLWIHHHIPSRPTAALGHAMMLWISRSNQHFPVGRDEDPDWHESNVILLMCVVASQEQMHLKPNNKIRTSFAFVANISSHPFTTNDTSWCSESPVRINNFSPSGRQNSKTLTDMSPTWCIQTKQSNTPPASQLLPLHHHSRRQHLDTPWCSKSPARISNNCSPSSWQKLKTLTDMNPTGCC